MLAALEMSLEQEPEPVVPEGINFSFQGGAELMLGDESAIWRMIEAF